MGTGTSSQSRVAPAPHPASARASSTKKLTHPSAAWVDQDEPKKKRKKVKEVVPDQSEKWYAQQGSALEKSRRGTIGINQTFKQYAEMKNAQKGRQIKWLPPARHSMLPNIFKDEAEQPKVMLKSDYPPPAPPRTRKEKVFVARRYTGLDNYVSKVPTTALYGDFFEVAEFLTQNCHSQIQKIRALYAWVTSVDLDHMQKSLDRIPDDGSPLDYLLKINWKMGNHPHFFAKLCRAIDIPALIITGMTKNALYEPSGETNRDKLAAQWNAVHVDGDWRLIDVYWGSMCIVEPEDQKWRMIGEEDVPTKMSELGTSVEGEHKHYRNDAFFLTNPDELIRTHYPDEAAWQLLQQCVTVDEFEKGPYIRERFNQMGMSLVNYFTCNVRTEEGEIEFEFGIPADRRKFLQFKSVLFAESDDRDHQNTRLDQHIFFQKLSDHIKFCLSFPFAGRFKFSIFGYDEKRDIRYDLCITHIIQCYKTYNPLHHITPLPDTPAIGWGPGAETDRLGMIATTHAEPIIECQGGHLHITFDLTQEVNIMASIKSNAQSDMLMENNTLVEIKDNQMTLSLRLPEEGEYALNIFASEEGVEGCMPNVCNYLIKCTGDADPEEAETFPRLHDNGLGRGQAADDYGVFPKSHMENVIRTETGDLTIEFEVRADTEQGAQEVSLFTEVSNNDVDGFTLADCVDYKRDGESQAFALKLPQPGEYGFNVYAKREGEEGVRHVYTYFIISTQPVTEKDLAQESSESVGGTKRRKKDKKFVLKIITIHTMDDQVRVGLPASPKPQVVEFLRKNAMDQKSRYEVRGRQLGKKYIFMVQLPEVNDFKMDVFEQYRNSLVLIRIYHIFRHEFDPVNPMETKHTILLNDKDEDFDEDVDSDDEDVWEDIPAGEEEKKETPVPVPGTGNKTPEPFGKTTPESVVKQPDNLAVIKQKQETEKRKKRQEKKAERERKKKEIIKNRWKSMGPEEAERMRLQELEEEKQRQLDKEEQERLDAEESKRKKEKAIKAEKKAKEFAFRIKKQKIQAAMQNDDLHALSKAIKTFEDSGLVQESEEGKEQLQLAKTEMLAKPIKAELSAAMESRELRRLDKALTQVEDNKLQEHCGLQYEKALQIKEQLQVLAQLRTEIMKLDNKTIAEIKSYQKPPKAVHFVMSATFFVMGEQEKSLRDWRSVVVLMGKSGKLGFKRRIQDFDIMNLSHATAKKALLMLSQFTFNELRAASKGAATVYTWTHAIIQECEFRYLATGGDFAAVNVAAKKKNTKQNKNKTKQDQ